MSDKAHNKHFLYMKFGVATREQITKCITDALVGHENVKFITNPIFGRPYNDPSGSEICYGYGFLWISDERVSNMLCGFNPDGTDRYQEIDDPTSKTPGKKIFVQLPPLIKIPPYEYNVDQLKHFAELINNSKYYIDTEIHKEGYIHVNFAEISQRDAVKNYDTIFSYNIPKWITTKIIRDIFSIYASDSETTYEKKIYGTMMKITYPYVNIIQNTNGTNSVFINFDPSTNDARYALLMTKKTLIEADGNRITMIFDHPNKKK